MPSLWLGLRTAAIYMALIAAATVYVFQLTSAPADTIETLSGMLPFQFLVAVYCVYIVRRYFGWRAVGFGPIQWRAMIWLAPAWVVLAAMGWNIAHALTVQDFLAIGFKGLAFLIVTPFVIAFAEEVMFRGILLRGAMATVPLFNAMLISAALFGAMHLINGVSGQDSAGTTQQIGFAVLVGFFLAPIAVKLGNLWPLIIWHWLWNIAVLTSQMADVFHPFVVIGIAMQTVVCIWLWSDLLRGKIAG